MALLVSPPPGMVLCSVSPDQSDYENWVAEEEIPAGQGALQPGPEDGQGVFQDSPSGSHFEEICIGMPLWQVTDLIGPPSDTKQIVTGKSFIPFYTGTDSVRLEAIYKGLGRITFSGRPLAVYRIVNNTREPGYSE